MTGIHTWDLPRLCWIDTFIGPPEIIKHDAGTNFDTSEFYQNGSMLSIQTKYVPVKATQSVGLVERYNGPLRRVYIIISDECKGHNLTNEIKL